MLLVDKLSDSRLMNFQNGSVNLKRLQIQFHHTWYSVCGNLDFFYGRLGHFEDQCSLDTVRDADSESGINSTHVVVIHTYKYLTIVEGNCATYGLPETRYFCQKRKVAHNTSIKFKSYVSRQPI